MRYRKKSMVAGMLLAMATPELASAAAIPLVGGLLDYSERARVWGEETNLGTDPARAESVHVAYGEVSGSATNTAGTAQTPASTLVSAYSKISHPAVYSNTDITFDARLIKLHPDAPDDIDIPLLYSSSMSATNNSFAELVIRAEEKLVQEQVQGSSRDLSSSLGVMSNEYLRVGIAAYADAVDSIETASASTPVFAIDPDFTVEFLGRTERAVDLYTLAVTPGIGFAGNFKTITPFTDGCLPDPSILAPSGLSSVTDGETINCQAMDPSGFRTYGNDPGIPSGILNDLQIIIPEDATVSTNVDGSVEEDGYATIGLLGNNNSIHNQGAIRGLGLNTNAVYGEGDGFTLINQGDIETQLHESEVVYIYGDESGVINEGNVTSFGILSSAIVVEGDGGFVQNEGRINTQGAASSGIVIEGDDGSVTNSGSIETVGDYSAGLVVLGNDSVGEIDNTNRIQTRGADAQGVLVVGLNHAINNHSGASISTSGDRAYGIALVLQEVFLPPGVEIPAALFDPASGTVHNAGSITTTGSQADAIHVFANNVEITHSWSIETSGNAAHGISVSGHGADITNSGLIKTDGIDARGIQVIGNSNSVLIDSNSLAEILATNNGGAGVYLAGSGNSATNQQLIQTGGTASHGIESIGTNSVITNDGGLVSTVGNNADAIRVTGEQTEIINSSMARLETEGKGAAGIHVLSAERATVTNRGSIDSSGDFSDDNYGIKAEFTGTAPAGSRMITNLGFIEVEGLVGSQGIHVNGDNVRIQNGELGVGGVSLTVNSGLATGIYLQGKDPYVSNVAPLAVTGDLIDGIAVVPEIDGVFLVENKSTMTLTGNGGTGMSVIGAGLQEPPAPGFPAGDCVSSPGGRDLINCGAINLFGNSLTGMKLESTGHTKVDNDLEISGSGNEQRGISASAVADSVITNFKSILLMGSNNTGIFVEGDDNTVLSGSGTTDFPDGFQINSFLDFVTNSNDDDGTAPRVGDISITGDNAVGIAVEGNNNRIGIRAYGQALASGSNAVGVKISGNNNLLVNDGKLVGTNTAIQGSGGNETVLNDSLIIGDVNLLAGQDTMVITEKTDQRGVVDGGDDIDILRVVVPRPTYETNAPASIVSSVDGAQYINFENLSKEGVGIMNLVGDLIVSNTDVQQGQLVVESGVTLHTDNATVSGTDSMPGGQGWIAVDTNAILLAEDTITLNEFGILGIVNGGMVVADDVIVNDGSILQGRGRVRGHVTPRGGQIDPGFSTGTLTIEGDLNMEAGLIVLEANSLVDKDALVVEGDVTLGGGFVDVVLGFTPDPEDIIEFMIIEGILNLSEGFGGIRGFATPGSNVALGTEFAVLLGGVEFQGMVTSAVPIPPGFVLFGTGLLSLVIIARRRSAY